MGLCLGAHIGLWRVRLARQLTKSFELWMKYDFATVQLGGFTAPGSPLARRPMHQLIAHEDRRIGVDLRIGRAIGKLDSRYSLPMPDRTGPATRAGHEPKFAAKEKAALAGPKSDVEGRTKQSS